MTEKSWTHPATLVATASLVFLIVSFVITTCNENRQLDRQLVTEVGLRNLEQQFVETSTAFEQSPRFSVEHQIVGVTAVMGQPAIVLQLTVRNEGDRPGNFQGLVIRRRPVSEELLGTYLEREGWEGSFDPWSASNTDDRRRVVVDRTSEDKRGRGSWSGDEFPAAAGDKVTFEVLVTPQLSSLEFVFIELYVDSIPIDASAEGKPYGIVDVLVLTPADWQ